HIASLQIDPEGINRLITNDQAPLIDWYTGRSIARLLLEIPGQRIRILGLHIQALDQRHIPHYRILHTRFPSLCIHQAYILCAEVREAELCPAEGGTLLSHNHVTETVPKKSSANGQAVVQEILIHSDIHALALLRFKIRRAKVWEEELIDGGSTKSCRIATADLGPGFLMEVAGSCPIRGRATKDVILILPHACRGKHSIPHIELSLGKACMTRDDVITDCRAPRTKIEIFPLLLSVLVAGRKQQRFANLKIVLPFNSIRYCVEF